MLEETPDELAPIKALGYSLVDHLDQYPEAIQEIREIIDGTRKRTIEEIGQRIEELYDKKIDLSLEEFTRQLELLHNELHGSVTAFEWKLGTDYGIEPESLPNKISIATADSVAALDTQLRLLWQYIDAAAQSQDKVPPDFTGRIVTIETGEYNLDNTAPIIGPVRSLFPVASANSTTNGETITRWIIQARYIEGFEDLQRAALKTRLAILERVLGKTLPVLDNLSEIR